jgi:hypothetical protein
MKNKMNRQSLGFSRIIFTLIVLMFVSALNGTGQALAQNNSDDWDETSEVFDVDKDCVRFEGGSSGRYACVTEDGTRIRLTEMQMHGLSPLTSREVTSTLRRYRGFFYKCARDYAAGSYGFSLISKFKINRSGNVEGLSVNLKSGPLSAAYRDSVNGCIQRVLSRVQFPKPRNGETVPVNYPITFR